MSTIHGLVRTVAFGVIAAGAFLAALAMWNDEIPTIHGSIFVVAALLVGLGVLILWMNAQIIRLKPTKPAVRGGPADRPAQRKRRRGA